MPADDAKTAAPAAGPCRDALLVDLALQGGGAHGALAWGVLDRLLEEPWLRIDGISGTLAGAMNAAVLDAVRAAGLEDADARRLRVAELEHELDELLEDVSRIGCHLLGERCERAAPGLEVRRPGWSVGQLVRDQDVLDTGHEVARRFFGDAHVDLSVVPGSQGCLIKARRWTKFHAGRGWIAGDESTEPYLSIAQYYLALCHPFCSGRRSSTVNKVVASRLAAAVYLSQRRPDTVGEFAGLAVSRHLTGSRVASGSLPGGPKPA